MGERTSGRNNNARTLVFAGWDAPRALSPRRRCHFGPLVAPSYGGTHVRSPLDAPEACCRLNSGYIFGRGRTLIAGLYGGNHARIPLGASKANPRLNFGYILARNLFRRLVAVRQESCSRLGAVAISDPWSSSVPPEERLITRACYQRSASPQERFIP